MDRNTIIAMVLTVIVITVGMTVQSYFIEPVPETTTTTETVEDVSSNTSAGSGSAAYSYTAVSQGSSPDPFSIETDAYIVTFDPAGASVSSIKLKDEGSEGEDLEILLKDSTGRNAFLLYPSDNTSAPVTDVFDYTIDNRSVTNRNGKVSNLIVVRFSQQFKVNGSDQIFTIGKEYAFAEDEEYLFQIAVSYSTDDGSQLPISFYTLGFDPQVGPEFQTLSGNYDYRRMYYRQADHNNERTVSFRNGQYTTTDSLAWAALAGKYFAIIGVPQSDVQYETVFTQRENSTGISQSNGLYFVREGVSGSRVTDIYSFYTGPKVTNYLNMYDLPTDNAFGVQDMKFNKVMETSAWLGWLETILKWILQFFNRIVHNYGISIILLTILVKLLLQPLSKKGMDSTAKMSALTPKMEELKVKYADDPNALNAAMAKLYKDEGINPMGSCIPMLIQFPIFIALYGLLNNHYELRGAMFIPGWIPDLSVPDTVYTLPFSIPFLGPQIHLLPILYTISMIFSMKITQASSTQSSQQGMMNFMTYGMPLIFFFVLYNAPSGLLLYWSTTNLISILQQLWVTKKKKKTYEAEIEAKDQAKIEKFSKRKKK